MIMVDVQGPEGANAARKQQGGLSRELRSHRYALSAFCFGFACQATLKLLSALVFDASDLTPLQ